MHSRQCASWHDEATIRGTCECRDGALDLAGVARADGAHVYAKRRCRGLNYGKLADLGDGSIPQHRHPFYAGRDLWPPGRARLSTKPALTGSGTSTKTMGTVRVTCCNAPVASWPVARITSGASATNSAAYCRR